MLTGKRTGFLGGAFTEQSKISLPNAVHSTCYLKLQISVRNKMPFVQCEKGIMKLCANLKETFLDDNYLLL